MGEDIDGTDPRRRPGGMGAGVSSLSNATPASSFEHGGGRKWRCASDRMGDGARIHGRWPILAIIDCM